MLRRSTHSRKPLSHRSQPEFKPRLTFSPRAWLKWQFLCHVGPTEVGAFGLSSVDDPLSLDDLLLISQSATQVFVQFDDHAVADLFDEMADRGIPPSRFARIWLHTHPGSSATPSFVDEQTFRRCFGGCDWSVMAILSRTGRTYARLQLRAGGPAGPGVQLPIATRVDWSGWPTLAADARFRQELDNWQASYTSLVTVESDRLLTKPNPNFP